MTTTLTKPTLKIAKKVLDTVDAGLCSGKGKPIPGQMCVEAAVCYAYGLPHSDQPPCVSPALRSFKIALNDKPWSSDAARANGLRRISIAQLGSNKMDDKEFTKRLSEEFIRVFVTQALRSAAKANPKHADKLEACARACEMTGSRQAALDGKEAAYAADAAYAAAYAAYAAAYAAKAAAYAAEAAAYAAEAAAYAADAAYAAYAANRDATYTLAAECCIEILRDMKQPGVKLMDRLCPIKK